MNNANSTFGSSGSLLERIRSMDKQAWDQFVEIYGPLIHRWCLQSGLSQADAADQVQEVFAAVIKSIERFQSTPNGSFRGWLWTITRNRIRDFVRVRQGNLNETGGTDLQMQLAQIADPIDVLDDESRTDPTSPDQTALLMRRAMRQIEKEIAPRTWQAFWKSVVDGDKTSDVAADLQMSTNNVRQAKSRVLRRLRQQLGEG